MKRSLKIVTGIIAVSTLVLSVLRLVPLRSGWGIPYWFFKLTSGALAPFMAVGGLVTGLLGGWLRAPLTVTAGLSGAALSLRYVRDVTASRVDYSRIAGPGWVRTVAARRNPAMLAKPWRWRLPADPEPQFQQDVTYATVPDTERALLCDLWQPGPGIAPSGLGIIYCHGSGWYLSDKDVGTRPFFRHLAAQGHVVMDVAYRMCPETNLEGMVADVKRAVVWMKDHAAELGVDPKRVILSGGSAGAHLAMLADEERCQASD